jgi:pimeloyl-ACP methyl ester carboxylesterase
MPLAHKSFGSDDGIPILFVHGWQLSNVYDIADFEPIFANTESASLVPGYRRIYIDLPGMGATPADGSIVDLQSMYDQVAIFIEQQISPSKFLLVGTSCGGYFARALATQFGEQILGVFLKVPMMEPDDLRRDRNAFKAIVEDEAAVRLAVSEEQSSSLGAILVQTPAYIRSLLAKMTISVWPAEMLAKSDVLDPIRNDPRKYSLNLLREPGQEKGFEKPSLIVTGRHDNVVGYRDVLRLLELYPRATFVVLDRGVHLLPVDEGDLVQSLVLDWLRRVEEFSRIGHNGDGV